MATLLQATPKVVGDVQFPIMAILCLKMGYVVSKLSTLAPF
jgi:hypothetical protein